MQATMDRQSFTSFVNEEFTFQIDGDNPIDFKLIEVRSLAAHKPPKSSTPVRHEPFSVLFVGPNAPIFDQQIFRLKNERFGQADIFLVPVGEADEGIEYEAVFT